MPARPVRNQHLLRELKFLWEEDGQVWAREMSALLLSFHRRRQQRWELEERQFKQARQRYRNVVRRGRYLHLRLASGQGRSAQSKAANLFDGWRILNGASWPSFGMDGCLYQRPGRAGHSHDQSAPKNLRLLSHAQRRTGVLSNP